MAKWDMETVLAVGMLATFVAAIPAIRHMDARDKAAREARQNMLIEFLHEAKQGTARSNQIRFVNGEEYLVKVKRTNELICGRAYRGKDVTTLPTRICILG